MANTKAIGVAFSDPALDSIDATGSTLPVRGQSGVQGGSVSITGGTSTSAANAGGAATITGGAPGATGVGGAASVTGGAGGSTSGTGGAASVTGGSGTAGNAAGGAASCTGGAGQGTAAGGSASLVGGASGTGATGNGGAANVTGGAAASTNGNGGSVNITPGAKAGTGVNGIIREEGTVARAMSRSTITNAATITVAQLASGILYQDASAGSVTMTTDTAANIAAAFPDMAVGDVIDVYMSSNHATNTSTIAGGASVTLVGSGAVTQIGGQLKLVKTASTPTFDLVRVG